VKAPIRAAGGVVSRPGVDGRLEVLLVYRARRDDWTFPKGKLLPGEDDLACARREVEEETGLRCQVGAELATTAYLTRSGRRKEVRYWAMRPVAGTAGPRHEVDAVRWAGVDAAATLLTHPRDRALLATFVRVGARWATQTPLRDAGARRARRRAPPRGPRLRSGSGISGRRAVQVSQAGSSRGVEPLEERS
jgi:8-oxo-dGTP diphosphatase